VGDAHRACPSCGRPLQSVAPEGLCPACLLLAGLTEALPPDAASAAEDATPGARRFGDYILLEEIARGGMGVVHKARQISLDRIVALKMILGGALAGPDQVQRFRAEARAAATLQHPNIVAIHEVGEHQGQLYFTMDYIEGKNLAETISDLRFEISNYTRSARWMKAVADAVHRAHQHGILHRDLKPANIIIDQNDQPHITDFGLAKRFVVPASAGQGSLAHGATTTSGGQQARSGTTSELTDAVGLTNRLESSQLSTLNSELTLSGQVLGSPSYLSPEQAEGKRGAVGVASDVYSIGAVLYHLLTGRPPFQGETLTALLRQVIESDPVAPRRLNPSIPRDLETICLTCLEKEPARRYAHAQGLADELGRFLANEPIQARPVGRAERTWRWCRRNPKLAGALGAAVMCLALGLGTTTWQMRRAQTSEATARHQAYVSDMGLAGRALAEENMGRVRSLLDRYGPPTRSLATAHRPSSTRNPRPATDVRAWEWQYLHQRTHSQAAFRLCTRPRSISGLAFTGDSRRLVVHERRGLTLVYDLETRHPIPGLVQTNFSWTMGFCAATEQVAFQASTGLEDGGEVRVWDLHSNAIVCRFPYTYDNFSSLTFSPDGRRLAASAFFAGTPLWDLATGNQVLRIPREASVGQVFTGPVVFASTGTMFAQGHRAKGLIRLHDATTGRVVAEFSLQADRTNVPAQFLEADLPGQTGIAFSQPQEVLALALSPDGRWLAASALVTNAVVRLWPLPSGEPIEFPLQRQSPWTLAFDPRSEFLAMGDNQIIRVYDLARRRLAANLMGHAVGVSALAFSPDRRWLASGSAASGADDAEVLFWDLATIEHPPRQDCQSLTNVAVAEFGPDAQSFLALLAGVVTRFDFESLRPIEPMSKYGSNNVSLAVSWDGRWLAHAQTNGTVHFWDSSLGHEQGSFCPYPGTYVEPGTMRILAGGRFLATRPDDGRIALNIWDTKTWHQPRLWRSLNALSRKSCRTVDATRDSQTLATGCYDGQIMLWDLSADCQIASFNAHRESVMELAFSADGRWLASAGWDGALRLWDVRERREAGSFGEPGAPYFGIAFSPDGCRVVSGGLAGAAPLVLWDVATCQHLLDLAPSGSFFFRPRFSADGRTLAVWNSARRTTDFWRVPALAQIDAERDTGSGR